MISAKEAKALYDASGAESDAMLATLEPYIVAAAKEGKLNCFILIDCIEVLKTITVTPLQHQVLDKLHKLGFRVSISKHGNSYVPRGLADDDGNSPKHQNYGYCIGW